MRIDTVPCYAPAQREQLLKIDFGMNCEFEKVQYNYKLCISQKNTDILHDGITHIPWGWYTDILIIFDYIHIPEGTLELSNHPYQNSYLFKALLSSSIMLRYIFLHQHSVDIG